MIPDILENLGKEIGNAWPLVVAIAFFVMIWWRGKVLLDKMMDSKVDKLEDQLGGIKYELTANGGSSLKDVLLKIDQRVHEMAVDYAEIKVGLKTFIESNSRAMYRSDSTGRTVEANQAYLDFWGFHTMSEARSNDWLSLVVDREKAEERLETIVESPSDFDYEMDLKDGRRMKVIGHPILNDGQFKGYIGYIIDMNTDNMFEKQTALADDIHRVEESVDSLSRRVYEHVEWEEGLKYPPNVSGFMAAGPKESDDDETQPD